MGPRAHLIATVLRSGGQYTPAHAFRLQRQAAAVAPDVPFVCLSDDLVPWVEVRPLKHGWPGWWSKIELFRRDVFRAGTRVLYLDLDTTIIGSLDELLERPEPFLGIKDFTRRPAGLTSGLMAWTAGGEASAIYERFTVDAAAIMRRCGIFGDGAWIAEQVQGHETFWQDVVPGQVVSYKVHCRSGVPAGARVVCYHGTPKPWHVEKAS